MTSIKAAVAIGTLAAGVTGVGWHFGQRQSMRAAERDRIADGMSPAEAKHRTVDSHTERDVTVAGMALTVGVSLLATFRPGTLHPYANAALVGIGVGTMFGPPSGAESYRFGS